ncbi:MAG: hypothetical protein ACRYGG_21055 [Janthinobacterium lividum]
MPRTPAQEQVDRLERMLQDNAGVKSVSVDGQTVVFDRVQAIEELEYWRRRAASGRRSMFRGINAGSAW